MVNVWVVEDSRMYRQAAAALLADADGVRCGLAVASCEEALAQLAPDTAPDIVLMDIGLPGMNGIEGTRRFKELSPRTQVVMLTVHEEHESIFEAICAGASGYLLKPSRAEEIVAAIRDVARGGSPINPYIARKVLKRFAEAGRSAAADQPDYGLTRREKEVLQLFVDGLTMREVAERLGTSYHTIDTHTRSVYEKLHVRSRGGAVAKAIQERLLALALGLVGLAAIVLTSGCAALYQTAGNYKEQVVAECDELAEYSPQTKIFDALLDCAFSAVALTGCEQSRIRHIDDRHFCVGYRCLRSLCPAEDRVELSPGEPSIAWLEPGIEFASASLPSIASSQRTALLAFYNAMNGPQWYDTTGWNGPVGTECDWFGVLCNGAKTTVTGLAFSGYNNLKGTLPAAIANLTDLEIFTLGGDYLGSQPFPAFLTSLTQLEVMVLEGNGFTGPLPATISKLTRLKMFVLAGQNEMTGPLPAGLSGLTSLKSLTLRNLNMAGALPADFSKLRNLESLVVSDTGMSGSVPASWASLTKLKSLDLSDNGLTGTLPSWLANLPQLRALTLDANNLEGAIPAGLSNLSNLEILNLSFNKLSGPIPASLSHLTKLRVLSLIGNGLTGPLPALAGFTDLVSLSIGPASHGGPFPASYLSLRQLQVLLLPKAGLTGAMPDLSLFSDLEEVNFENNLFAAAPPPSWVGVLPRLRKILLSGTNLQGTMPDLSLRASQLTHLGLGRNAWIAGPVPAWLSQMTKLTSLDIESAHLTGPLPEIFANLPRLEFLDLSGNPFTPGPIPNLTNLRFRLFSLDLADTARSGPLPATLAQMAFLQRLALADNRISGTLDRTLIPPNLVELDLSRNLLRGAIPADIGFEGQLLSLQLAGNKFAGALPPGLISLADLLPGSLVHPLYGKHVGLDLRFNALSTNAASLVAFAKSRHEGGVDFQLSQTLPPKNGKATALSATSIKLTWEKVAYQGAGSHTIHVGKAAAGPFTVAGQVAKSATSFTVTGLKAKTKYFFRLATTTPAHAQNPNAVTSAPSAVISATTP